MWCRKTNIPIVERPGRRHETPGIVIIESNSEESVGNCGRKRHSAARTLKSPKSDVSRVNYCSKATATSSLAFFCQKNVLPQYGRICIPVTLVSKERPGLVF